MKSRGFTLVELMVVVGVIAILAAVAIPYYGRYRCKADWAEVQSVLADVAIRMENYRSDRGTYPTADHWTALGYDGVAPDNNSSHYAVTVESTASTYLVYMQDTKREINCTAGSAYDNDTWAVINTSSKVFHVYNTVDESTDPLPAPYSL